MNYQELNLSLKDNKITEESLVSLGNCFGHVNLSYKFYWMMALIQKVAVEGLLEMSARSLAIEMVGMAWKPIRKHQLGLGDGDGFKPIIDELYPLLSVGPEASVFDVTNAINFELGNPRKASFINRLLNRLLNNVPYCYLQPWTHLNREACIEAINQNSSIFTQKCAPYSLSFVKEGRSKELLVHVNPYWENFIFENSSQLFDFSISGLHEFVQNRNNEALAPKYMLDWRVQPNVIQHQLFFWDNAIRGGISTNNPLHCLFTQHELQVNGYRIDHYLPFRFAESEKLWSTFPADLTAEISRTGNHFQQIAQLLPRLAQAQQMALSNFLKMVGNTDLLAPDYGDWNLPIQNLASMPSEQYKEMLYNRISRARAEASNVSTAYKAADDRYAQSIGQTALPASTSSQVVADCDCLDRAATRKPGRPAYPFEYYVVDQLQKEKILKVIDDNIYGKRGKAAAMVILAAINAGLLRKPSYEAFKNRYTDIISENSYRDYLKDVRSYDKTEYNNIYQKFLAIA